MLSRLFVQSTNLRIPQYRSLRYQSSNKRPKTLKSNQPPIKPAYSPEETAERGESIKAAEKTVAILAVGSLIFAIATIYFLPAKPDLEQNKRLQKRKEQLRLQELELEAQKQSENSKENNQ